MNRKKKEPENMVFFTPSELCEMRITKTETKDTLEGYAGIFNQPIQIGGEKWGWKESIAPGALKKTIKEGDARGLINHDSNLILARKSSGTLRLAEDKRGLHYEMDLGRQSYALDLRESIERGDITGNSFSFRAIREEWNKYDDERILLEVQLFDLGPVTFPANESTNLSFRSALFKNGIDIDELAEILNYRSGGNELDEPKKQIIDASINTLRQFLPGEPEPEPDLHSTQVIGLLRRRAIEIAELESTL